MNTQGRRKDWLADQLGLSPDYFSKMLHGDRPLSVERRHRIAALLGVPYSMIFGKQEAT